MPNGGADNCGTCGYNLANKGAWGPPGCGDGEAYCSMRILPIPNPFWTYCANWQSRGDQPEGPLFATGLHEHGYTRIPWDGEDEPRPMCLGRCHVCNREFERGLRVAAATERERQFCCNAHYMEWWRLRHPEVKLEWEYDFCPP